VPAEVEPVKRPYAEPEIVATVAVVTNIRPNVPVKLQVFRARVQAVLALHYCALIIERSLPDEAVRQIYVELNRRVAESIEMQRRKLKAGERVPLEILEPQGSVN
jgi:hypothetical protein